MRPWTVQVLQTSPAAWPRRPSRTFYAQTLLLVDWHEHLHPGVVAASPRSPVQGTLASKNPLDRRRRAWPILSLLCPPDPFCRGEH